ncbi:MAG TPA: hypothetical protein VM639_11565 [Dongiaceae bacterium]|nr:hypothetical protein [Dongiaceae bacterium]
MPDNRTTVRLELSAAADAPAHELARHEQESGHTAGLLIEATDKRRLKPLRLKEPASPARDRSPFQLDPDLITLFYTVDAMKSDDEPYVLQFLSATSGEGTTTIAWGFAIAASLERNQAVLVIDCSGGEAAGQPLSLLDAVNGDGMIENAIEHVPQMKRLFRARLCSSANPLLEIDGADLRNLLAILKENFPVVVLDCPAASAVSDSLAISRYCDATALVVRADHARREVIDWAKQSIERFGGQVIGAIFNDRKKYIPDWLYRRL